MGTRDARESLFGHSFGAVVSCEQFQQMPIVIAEVNVAATIPVVDFHVVRGERPAAIHQSFRLHATENIVEFGFPDLKGIVVRLERLAVVEVEAERLTRDANRSEMSRRPLALKSQNPFIEACGFFLVLRRHDGVIQFDFHDCAPQKLLARRETRHIAINLKSGDQKHKTSVDDENLHALAERLGRFVMFLVAALQIDRNVARFTARQ